MSTGMKFARKEQLPLPSLLQEAEMAINLDGLKTGFDKLMEEEAATNGY